MTQVPVFQTFQKFKKQNSIFKGIGQKWPVPFSWGGEDGCTLSVMIFWKRYRKIREIITGAGLTTTDDTVIQTVGSSRFDYTGTPMFQYKNFVVFWGGEYSTERRIVAILITKKTATTNTTKASGRSIKYIVVHYTAGTSSDSGAAANTAAYFSKITTKASADFICDDDTIVQYNPDIENRYCWHCGGSKLSGSQGGSLYKTVTNKNSIGVEICFYNS